MKFHLPMLLAAAVTLAVSQPAAATMILSSNSPTDSVGGDTVTLEGNLAEFGRPADRWSDVGDGGDPTNLQGTTGGPVSSDDFYWFYNGSDFDAAGPLATDTYRYVEIFYSISGGTFTGNDNRARLQTTNESQAFDNFADPTIPATIGRLST